MTAFREIVNELPGFLLRTYFILLLIGQIAVCVFAFLRRRSLVYKLLNLIHFCISLWVFTLVIDGTFHAQYLGYPRTYPAAVEFVYSLPWWIFVVAAAAETVVLILLRQGNKRFSENSISYSSLKEALDLLPEGMGYYRPGGTPVMVNRQMNRLAETLTGEPLADPEVLWTEAVGYSKSEAPPLLLPLKDGETVLLSRSEPTMNEQRFLHLTSEDITEQYRITADLRGKNDQLMDIRRRYHEYSRNMVALEREKSLYAARADAHSELGHALLIAKTYLEGVGAVDGATLYDSLKKTNASLVDNAGVRESGTQKDPCAAAVRKASEIGVSVLIKGELPKNENAVILLARAIDECSTNAAKHAKATLLTVTLEYASGIIMMRLSHKGSDSKGKYTEAGGLLLLRHETESEGGTMQTVPSPDFTVIITLPDSAENPGAVI